MDIAKCADDGVYYNAVDFSQLPPVDLDRKRRLLQCPECGAPAFFRKASPIGRGACFGGRPHSAGCRLTAFDYVRPEYGINNGYDDLFIPNSQIIVDFDYGTPKPVEVTVPPPMLGREGRNSSDDYRFDTPTHRRPSSLLRMLIESPAFRNSNMPVETFGISEITVRDFFVPLLDVTAIYLGKFRGYWGLLSSVKLSDDKKSVWFNSGGRDNISFRLDVIHLNDFNQRYRFNDEEDLAGAYILVFGMLKYSPTKNYYCEIEDLNFMALKFT